MMHIKDSECTLEQSKNVENNKVAGQSPSKL